MTDLDIIVLMAIRYARPRRTYAPRVLLGYLAEHVNELSGPGRKQMAEEIAEERGRGGCDLLPWDGILRLLEGPAGGEVAV